MEKSERDDQNLLLLQDRILCGI